jgi:hypothetical protein
MQPKHPPAHGLCHRDECGGFPLADTFESRSPEYQGAGIAQVNAGFPCTRSRRKAVYCASTVVHRMTITLHFRQIESCYALSKTLQGILMDTKVLLVPPTSNSRWTQCPTEDEHLVIVILTVTTDVACTHYQTDFHVSAT